VTQPWREVGGAVILGVRATPRSSRDDVGGCWRDAEGQSWLSVKVRAAPDDGAANKAVIVALAKALALPKSSITLDHGAASRLKRFKIVCKANEIDSRLRELAGERE
jgi:uncharacterized protein YggU (UPF0235/DUF167 family)